MYIKDNFFKFLCNIWLNQEVELYLVYITKIADDHGRFLFKKKLTAIAI